MGDYTRPLVGGSLMGIGLSVLIIVIGQACSQPPSCPEHLTREVVRQTDGAYTCIAPSYRHELADAGIANDGDLKTIADLEPRYDNYELIGHSEDRTYVYELTGHEGSAILIIHLDANGQIDKIGQLDTN